MLSPGTKLDMAAREAKCVCSQPARKLTGLNEADQDQQHHAEAQVHLSRMVGSLAPACC